MTDPLSPPSSTAPPESAVPAVPPRVQILLRLQPMNVGNQAVASVHGPANPYAHRSFRLSWGDETFNGTLDENGQLMLPPNVNGVTPTGILNILDDDGDVVLTIPIRRVPVEALPASADAVHARMADTLAAIARRLRNLSFLNISPTTGSPATNRIFWRALGAYMFKNGLTGWESALDPGHAVASANLLACLEHLVHAHDDHDEP